jgi:hypothetical protein
LSVAAKSGTGFAGRGTAWFDERTVAEFAELLRAYPLPADEVVELVGGSQPLGGELLVQVGIHAYPIGVKGQVGFGIELARSPWQTPAMRPREEHCSSFEVLTTYQRLGEFSSDLLHLLAGQSDTAVIGGESLI